jgi:hypothetical protein
MEKIIGLSGWARSGKDTIADHLVVNYGYTKISFADPMRKALVALNPRVQYWDSRVSLATIVRLVGWEALKDGSLETREMLQRFGTEVGREMFGQNFWIDQAFKEAAKYEKVVFSDCRFLNEAEAIKNANGVVWRVNKDNITAPNNHVSETQLNEYKFDLTIPNNGTLENLYKLIDQEISNV